MQILATDDLEPFMATMVGHGPATQPQVAERLVQEFYNLETSAERLTGERDENFRLRGRDDAQYVFKISHVAEAPVVAALATDTLLHLQKVDPSLPCPRVVRATDGHAQIPFTDDTGQQRMATLVTFLHGKRLNVATRSPQQRAACGRLAARLTRALHDFDHPASRRLVIWDLQQVPRLRALLADMPELPAASFIASFIERFESNVAPTLASVRHQFVHNDLNSTNILVAQADESLVTGIIDFGDAVRTALIADVAIAAVAQITSLETMFAEISDFLAAYQEVALLQAAELAILNELIAARMVQGLLIPSWHCARNPGAAHFQRFDTAHFQRRIALIERLLRTPIAVSDPA